MTPATDGTPHIAHVLMMDVVKFSKLATDHQMELRERLRQIVRSIPDFPRALEGGSLILRDTGDGMALAFFGDFTAPINWARQIAAVLLREPRLPVRMGIHTGPVYLDTDLTGARNLAGDGINMAQRVMDCGDAGHILVSSETARHLGHISAWKSALHDLGEVEVKHGVRVHIFNVYAEGFGNPALPDKLAPSTQRNMGGPSRDRAIASQVAGGPGKKAGRGASKTLVIALALLPAVLAGGGYWWMIRHGSTPSSSRSQPRGTDAAALPSPVAAPVILRDGFPILLILAEEIPASAPEGFSMQFQVAKDVRVDNDVVIAKGAAAAGAIIDVAKKKMFGMGGKTTFHLETVDAVDGRKVAIRATQVRDPEGSSKRPVDTGGRKPKDVAAAVGTRYWGYIDGTQTVSVKR